MGDATQVIQLTRAALRADDHVVAAIKRTASQIDSLVGDDGYYPFGVETLRVAIADRFTVRGLATTSDQIMITAGAQQAIDLVIRALVQRRDAIIVESPAYAGVLDSLRLAHARIVTLSVADRAWDLDALDALLAQTGARLMLLTPDFRNPTGRLMPDCPRAGLVALARRRSAMVVVDETLCELDLSGEPLPRPLAAHAGRDPAVVTIGSLASASGRACASGGCGRIPGSSRGSRTSAPPPTSVAPPSSSSPPRACSHSSTSSSPRDSPSFERRWS